MNISTWGVIVPACMAGILAIILIFLLVTLIWKKYCSICGDTGDHITDIEALTENFDDDSGGYANAVFENVQEVVEPQPPVLSGASSRSSIVDIEEGNSNGTSGNKEFVSRSIQTEPVVESVIIEVLDCLDEQDNSLKEVRHCCKYNKPSSSGRAVALQGVGTHFDDFEQFASFVTQHQQEKSDLQLQPILKPIREHIINSSTSTLSTTASNSSTELHSPSSSSISPSKRKSKGKFCYDIPRRERCRSLKSKAEDELMKQRDFLHSGVEEEAENSSNKVGEINKALELISLLRKSWSENEKSALPQVPLSALQAKYGIKFLEEVQKFESKGHTSISLAQELILLQNPGGTGELMKTEISDSPLIIGVDATDFLLGGYCVNLHEKKIEYYAIREIDNVWRTRNSNNPAEFEMKNLLLALSLWNEDIQRSRMFSIYTDNNAVNKNNEFGRMVTLLLGHFRNCLQCKLVNKDGDIYVNRTGDLESFAKYIQPADDLSRWKIHQCTEFLRKYYGISQENIGGIDPGRGLKYASGVPHYYVKAFDKVNNFIDSLRMCSRCSCSDIIKLLSSVDLDFDCRSTSSPLKSSKKHCRSHVPLKNQCKRRNKLLIE